jgi:hypothetical protein
MEIGWWFILNQWLETLAQELHGSVHMWKGYSGFNLEEEVLKCRMALDTRR